MALHLDGEPVSSGQRSQVSEGETVSGTGSAPQYAWRDYDKDPLWWEFGKDISVRLDRVESAGMMPGAVLLREDVFPLLTNWCGYPVIRMARASPQMWGVLA